MKAKWIGKGSLSYVGGVVLPGGLVELSKLTEVSREKYKDLLVPVEKTEAKKESESSEKPKKKKKKEKPDEKPVDEKVE